MKFLILILFLFLFYSQYKSIDTPATIAEEIIFTFSDITNDFTTKSDFAFDIDYLFNQTDGVDKGDVFYAIGAPFYPNGGAIYILSLNTTTEVSSIQLIDPSSEPALLSATITAGDNFGWSVAFVDDINNDGILDIAAGSTGNDDFTINSGCVYILTGNSGSGLITTYYKITSTQEGFTYGLPSAAEFGQSVAWLDDLDQTGSDDIAVSASGDFPGTVYILLLDFGQTDIVTTYYRITPSSPGFTTLPFTNSFTFGGALDSPGGKSKDLDGDKINDLIISEPDNGSGLIYLVQLLVDGSVKTYTTIYGTDVSFTSNDRFGSSVSSVSKVTDELNDLDNDGIGDLIIGAEDNSDFYVNAGAFAIIYLNSIGQLKSYDKFTLTTGLSITEYTSTLHFGASIGSSGHDFNDDGHLDILIGAPSLNSSEGSFYLISLTQSTTLSPTTTPVLLNLPVSISISYNIGSFNSGFTTGLSTTSEFGSSIANLYNDINDDSIEDYAVGTPGFNKVYIIHPTSNGEVSSSYKIDSTSMFFTTAILFTGTDRFGSSVTFSKNIDNDDNIELIVGAPGYNGSAGAIYLIFLNSIGQVKTSKRITQFFTQFFTSITSDTFGSSLGQAGDIDDDGVDDIIVGASGIGISLTHYGAVFWLSFNTIGNVKTYQKLSSTDNNILDASAFTTNGFFGTSVQLMGGQDHDLNNDSYKDFLISKYGTVYIVFGDESSSSWGLSSFNKIDSTSVNLFSTTTSFTTFGYSVSPFSLFKNSDVDNDNIQDILIGFPQDNNNKGSIYLVMLKSDGGLKTYQRLSNTDGSFTTYITLTTGDRFGSSIGSFDGDFTNNNNFDILIGAPGGDFTAGEYYFISLNSAPTKFPTNTPTILPTTSFPTRQPTTNAPTDTPIYITSPIKISSTGYNFEMGNFKGGFTTTLNTGSHFGQGLANLYTDFDFDGINDIAIGRPGDNRVYIVFQSSTGIINNYNIIATFTMFTTTATSFGTTDEFGYSLSPMKDFDNDGNTDLVVGAPGANSIWLLSLKTNGTVKTSILIPLSLLETTFTSFDRFGISLSISDDIDDDGNNDLIVGRDGSFSMFTGAVYFLSFTTNGNIKTYEKISSTSNNIFTNAFTESGYFGRSVALMGGQDHDLDNDGIQDWIIGKSNAIYIVFGGTLNGWSLKSSNKINFTTFSGFTTFITFGSAITPFGQFSNADIDNDFVQDIIVGDNGFNSNRGAIYLLFLTSFGQVKTYTRISNIEGSLSNTFTLGTTHKFGSSLLSYDGVDYNSDNTFDILVGVPYSDATQGQVFFLSLTGDGTSTPTQAPTSTPIYIATSNVYLSTSNSFTASQFSDFSTDLNFAKSVSSLADDYNFDGLDEYIIGMPWISTGGTVHMVYPDSGWGIFTSRRFDGSSLINSNIGTGNLFGYSVCVMNDLNDNGLNDFVVGDISDDGISTNSPTVASTSPSLSPTTSPTPDSGAIYLISLTTSGNIETHTKIDQTDIFTLNTGSNFGSSLSPIGDINEDGIADIAVGALNFSNGANKAGAIFFIYLSSSNQVSSFDQISENSDLPLTTGSFFTNLQFGTSIAIPGGDNNLLENNTGNEKFDPIIGTGNNEIFILNIQATNGFINSPITYSVIGDFSGGLTRSITSTDRFGESISPVGYHQNSDLDGDGVQDILVGAPGYNNNNGAFYILYLKTNSNVKTYNFLTNAFSSFTTVNTFGTSIGTFSGDNNFNNNFDIIVGSPTEGSNGGFVYILQFGENVDRPLIYKTESTSLNFRSFTFLDYSNFNNNFSNMSFGYDLDVIDDIDRDGILDIIVSAPQDGFGSVYIMFLNTNSSVKSYINYSRGDLTATQLTAGTFGNAVTSLNDINSDGMNDIAISHSSENEVFILLLNTNYSFNFHKISSTTMTDFFTTNFGSSLCRIDDLNKDGVDDLIIGADTFGISRGSFYIAYLSSSGSVSSSQFFSATFTATFPTLFTNDRFGSSLSDVGNSGSDLNYDGNADIIIGAPFHDNGTGNDSGAIFIISFNSNMFIQQTRKYSATTHGLGIETFSNFGSSVSNFGDGTYSDLDNDGYQDIIVGGNNDQNSRGAIWILYFTSNFNIKEWQEFSTDTANKGFNTLNLATLDYFGTSMIPLFDLNNDGFLDIIVSAPQHSNGGTVGSLYFIDIESVFNNPTISQTTLAPTTSAPTQSPTPSPRFTNIGCEDPDCTQCLTRNITQCYACDETAGVFHQNSTASCETCDSLCTSCFGSASNECFGCESFIDGNAYYLDVIGVLNTTSQEEYGSCQLCDSQCKRCNGGTSDDCTKCFAGKYVDKIANKAGPCVNCDPSCDTCTGPETDDCTSCTNRVLFSGSCFSYPYFAPIAFGLILFIIVALASVKILGTDPPPRTTKIDKELTEEEKKKKNAGKFELMFIIILGLYDFASDIVYVAFARFEERSLRGIGMLLLITPTILFCIENRKYLWNKNSKLAHPFRTVWNLFDPIGFNKRNLEKAKNLAKKVGYYRKGGLYLNLVQILIKIISSIIQGILLFLIMTISFIISIPIFAFRIILTPIAPLVTIVGILLLVNAKLMGSPKFTQSVLGITLTARELHYIFNSSFFAEIVVESIPQLAVTYLNTVQTNKLDTLALISIFGSGFNILNSLVTIFCRIWHAGSIRAGLALPVTGPIEEELIRLKELKKRSKSSRIIGDEDLNEREVYIEPEDIETEDIEKQDVEQNKVEENQIEQDDLLLKWNDHKKRISDGGGVELSTFNDPRFAKKPAPLRKRYSF